LQSWLNQLVKVVQDTLRDQIYECYTSTTGASDNLDEKILKKYASQVLATSRALHFTRQAEQAIGGMSLGKLQQQLKDEINHLAALKNKSQNGTLISLKIRALLLDLVHYSSVVEQLQKHNVVHTGDWHWLCQLRYYLGKGTGTSGGVNTNRQVCVRMVYAEFEYAYEFLGQASKLVHTRLTHRCYLILTQAMHMGLGGNPFGPAGTGKTECVKALGAMLGRLVLVFNCDEVSEGTLSKILLTMCTWT